MQASELHQISCPSGDDATCLRVSGDRNAMSSPKLHEPFIAKLSERAKDRVGIDAQYFRQITGGRESLSGGSLTLGDGTSDLSGNLFVQQRRITGINPDSLHYANHTSTISDDVKGYENPAGRRPRSERSAFS